MQLPSASSMALMLCHHFHLETYRYFGRVFPSELLQRILADYLTLTYDSIRDFHALALLPLPFFGAFIAHRRQRYVAFMVWCLVILAIREDLVLIPISWAVIGLIQSRTRRWIIGPFALAACYLLFYLAASKIWQPTHPTEPPGLLSGLRPLRLGDLALRCNRSRATASLFVSRE